MKVLVDTAKYDHGPEKYVEKSEADEVRSGSDYRDYDQYFVFETQNIDEVLEKLDYLRFVVDYQTKREDIDVVVTVYDYYI